jgi:ABC-2 type transport system permease protein
VNPTTTRVFLALLRQELRTIAHYRWWLVAMQASVVTGPLISLLVARSRPSPATTSPRTWSWSA